MWLLLLLLGCPPAAPPDTDGDGWADSEDCLPADPEGYPDALERCNGFDDDCDSVVDEGFDQDEDGFEPCTGDCDDGDPSVAPFAPELCNDRDDDCDGELGPAELTDLDGDGSPLCLDCDDQDAQRFPDSPEHCDDVDHDCDGDPRTGEPAVLDGVTTWFGGDGFDEDDAPCATAQRILVCGDLRQAGPLPSTSGIDCVAEVTGSVLLEAINATFADLERIGGDLELGSVEGSISLSLPALREVGSIEILWAEGPVTLSVPALVELGGLEIRWSEGRVEVGGPLAKVSLAGNLAITSNGGDVFVTGFSGPGTLGEVSIGGNTGALAIDGFAGPLSVSGDVTIGNNAQLGALELGLDGLDLGGTLFVEGNPLLESARLGVSSTGGWFRVQENPLLQTLEVSALETVFGNFILADNGALADLSGFGALGAVAGDLSITDNGSLPSAVIDALLDQVTVGGVTNISGNGP